MNIDKLNKWAELLLDTGKRNNLINFRDSKAGSVEVVSPSFDALFSKIDQSATFEVFNPKFANDDDELYDDGEDDEGKKNLSKEAFVGLYERRLKKNKQILVYNAFVNPISALRNIRKKSKTAIEETGVNIAYMAFGFVNWTEDENSRYVMRAPILLIPVSIENETAIDPYYVKITDSDIVVNPTFSFKLKNDYGLELPEYVDESAEEYLQHVERLVSKLKWTVTRECKIGIFSFLKINMYKDLKDNAEKVLENKCVSSLLGEEDVSDDDSEKKVIDDTAPLNNVVDADSSQTEAIELARSGKSFVLQGPPGTGKSQTITNIIAECLAQDKKVLFVSEKLAALNVVYDKLRKAGLDEFCLELHSHKANKKDVIADLCRTLKDKKSILSDRAKKETETKIQTQKELDQYAVELHKIRPVINKTLYKLYEEVSACRKAPDMEYVIPGIKNKGEEYINQAKTALNRYAEYTRSVGYDYHQNVWYGYVFEDSSFETAVRLKSDLKDSITLLENIKSLNRSLNEKYSISAKNMRQAYALGDFFNLVKNSGFVTPALLNAPSLSNVVKTVASMRDLANEILKRKRTIDDMFDEDIYKLDGQTLYKKLIKEFKGFFSRVFSWLFFGEYRRIKKELKLCKKHGKGVNYRVAVSMTDALRVYQQKSLEFNALEEKVVYLFGENYNGVNTDFRKLMKELDKLTKICSAKPDFALLKTFDNQKFNEEKGEFSTLSDCFEESFKGLEEAEERVVLKYDLREYDVRQANLEILEEKYRGCLDNVDKLDDWCEFVKLLKKLEVLDLRDFVDSAIKKCVAAEEILPVYKKAFYRQWIDAVLHDSPLLIKLSRVPHDEAVKLFKTKDKLEFEINKAKIKAKLSAKRPDLDMIAHGGAVAVLLREGEKKRKQKGIRKLLEEIGELTQTLKPCFLMSPLSVSTFLSPDMRFDVVIFDEASQVFPQDAVGAIYRGKQLIVVGDSKQMPPSNFFNGSTVSTDDDEETDDVTDFESILDICSVTFPQKRLKWHYRSRFEQLISFSNKNFYENELITFPSPKKNVDGCGVDYIYVDGVFDRQTKTNRAEAEKIVDLVFENIEKYPNRSLGVVAFSISQQTLIEKLIAKRRQQDASKEPFFKSDREEPFFVKNLETVQGDERDTIIFSIAYGKDSQGRLILNFGPINREGGERRLNVAFTRAKYNVRLVSSMRHTDIDLSKTQSVGVKLLKEYLDYAENGEIALERAVSVNTFEEYDSEFETEVCEFLRAKGYSVDTQVGCSSFKIDLALKNPDTSDYLLAIECDGASYHSSKNARDRDRLRQEILERIGWKFYRIWSTDWFRNNRAEKERLLFAVKSAVENASVRVDVENPSTDVSFEEVAEVKHFEFPEYVRADDYKTAEKYNYDELNVIRAIVEPEAPIAEEWVLKRVAFLFDREKVTSVMRDEFDYVMRNCAKYNIVRKDGFLYIKDRAIPMLRVPKKGSETIRDIKYIAPEELALGMKEILKQNVTVEKDGLYRLLVNRLGFSRVGDAMLERLEAALRLISNDIEINGNTLSLK